MGAEAGGTSGAATAPAFLPHDGSCSLENHAALAASSASDVATGAGSGTGTGAGTGSGVGATGADCHAVWLASCPFTRAASSLSVASSACSNSFSVACDASSATAEVTPRGVGGGSTPLLATLHVGIRGSTSAPAFE